MRLYERDDAHFAMLLERPSDTSLAEIDAEEAVRVAGDSPAGSPSPRPPTCPGWAIWSRAGRGR